MARSSVPTLAGSTPSGSEYVTMTACVDPPAAVMSSRGETVALGPVAAVGGGVVPAPVTATANDVTTLAAAWPLVSRISLPRTVTVYVPSADAAHAPLGAAIVYVAATDLPSADGWVVTPVTA